MTHTHRVHLPCVLVALSAIVLSASGRTTSADSVTSGPRGVYPYLFKGVGQRSALAPSANDPSWSLLAHSRGRSGTDTLHIIALMVEFNKGRPDSTTATTGTGLFNIWQQGTGTSADVKEYQRYDTLYHYDRLEHDQAYFQQQLAFAKRYFEKVSAGRFTITYDVFPKTPQKAYQVDTTMAVYSPGGKKKKESWDEYYNRKTKQLMRFVVDAVRAGDGEQGATGNPFRQVHLNTSGNPVDSNGNPVGFLIIHAGASYLTDGGTNGAYGADSPSDMIDAFISRDFFRYYKADIDSTSDQPGIRVHGADTTFMLDEVMMTCETSNQDGLNWGIHGILVNQIARQIGIPDLFSTSSGISGIGAFCIMDYAGYSAGQGFIPPWPSAWVRAFMGWDEPKVVAPGVAGSRRIKAVGLANHQPGDTTILLVPINDHEYFLVENRQRNPGNRPGVFKLDTLEKDGRKDVHLASYPYNAVLPACVTDSSGLAQSNVILDAFNYDVGIPASGVLIWHVDEDVIRHRLSSDLVNADSLYRGIALVEADGLNQLGITFQNAFYQAAFDWGGAEDVFPHVSYAAGGSGRLVDSLGPYTRPSTRSNDGGQTYLTMRVTRAGTGVETYAIADYLVTDCVDTAFDISLNWSYLAPGWPKRIPADSAFEPLAVDIAPSSPGSELLVLSRSGRLSVLSAQGNALPGAPRLPALSAVVTLRGDTLRDSSGSIVHDTAFYTLDIPGAAAMPSWIDSAGVFMPRRDSTIDVLRSIDAAGSVSLATIPLGHAPTTQVCHCGAGVWAVGCRDGAVVFGQGLAVSGAVLNGGDPVTAIAALARRPGVFACVQNNGTVLLCAAGQAAPLDSGVVSGGIGPYTLATGDLNHNDSGASEIVVCDSRHGLWVLDSALRLAPGWNREPNDWASAWAANEQKSSDRALLPVNLAAPALADINGDGCLDILLGGTNGVYALNYKGVLVKGWPRYLDNRYWLQRGSITSSPVVGADANSRALVLFSSPTGDNPTFTVAHVDSTNSTKTKVYYRRDDGARDSLWDLSPALVDSILRFNDSLVAPFVLPGGYVDAVNATAERPLHSIATLPAVGREALYDWPLTVGSTMGSAPLICDLNGDDTTDLIAVSASGWAYRWVLPSSMLGYRPDDWRMAGYNAGRAFAYMGAGLTNRGGADTVGFYSFPNPTNSSDKVVFRYAFKGKAKNVRIDIFTYTGNLVYHWTEPAGQTRVNYPDWNELVVPISNFGPAVYRCRLGATVEGKAVSRFWKLAVVK